MTQQQHPITPVPELINQWLELPISLEEAVIQAARWGADMELEACCEWVIEHVDHWPNGCDTEQELRAARRPKAPSLKEQALAMLSQHNDGWAPSAKEWDTIRRALEALPDD